MKKLIALLMVLLVAGAAFAQFPDGLSIGGWGRADFVPFQGIFSDDDDVDPVIMTGVGSGWGPAYMGLNFRFSAADGRVGGGADISRGTGGPSDGDEVNIWTKPFGSDILFIGIGQFRKGDFRGPGTDGDFQGFIGGPGKNGDAVFQRFAPNAGALFISKPVEGLSLFAQVDHPGDMTGIGPIISGDVAEAKDTYKKIQAGFAYDISGIGLARAQWVGNSMDLDFAALTANPARIEAAFKLRAVEGLNLDIGLKVPIAVKEEIATKDVTYQDNFQINLAGDFKSGDFGITYGLYTAFGGSVKVEDESDPTLEMAPTCNVILVPSFYLAGLDATVGGDIGLKIQGESKANGTARKDDAATFGIGVWLSRNLGKGDIKTGLAFHFPDSDAKPKETVVSLPIIMHVSF